MRVGMLSAINIETSVGGVEAHIHFLSKCLKKRGHEVVIYTPIEADNFKNEMSCVEGITIKYIPVKTNNIFKYFKKKGGGTPLGLLAALMNKSKYFFHKKRVADFIRKDKNDLIHQHDFIESVFVTKRLSKDMACILTNHTGAYIYMKRFFVGRLFSRHLLGHYRAVIAPSAELRPEWMGAKAVAISNGVDTEMFNAEYDRVVLRKKYGLAPEDFVVLCPRRWAPTKGVIYLLEAIRRGGFDGTVKFVFCGNDYDGYPKYKEECMRLFKDVKDKNSVILLGDIPIDEMADCNQMSDLVVVPSLFEAICLSALEAMACGKPVVASCVGGMQELIEHGENGLLVTPKDPGAIGAAIRRLFEDRDLYRKVAENSLSTAKNYSWERVTIETEKVYERVLGSYGDARSSSA